MSELTVNYEISENNKELNLLSITGDLTSILKGLGCNNTLIKGIKEKVKTGENQKFSIEEKPMHNDGNKNKLEFFKKEDKIEKIEDKKITEKKEQLKKNEKDENKENISLEMEKFLKYLESLSSDEERQNCLRDVQQKLFERTKRSLNVCN